MKFFFYIPGMPFDGETIEQGKSLGGSESSGYFLARELERKGNKMTVFCNCQKAGKTDGITYIPIGRTDTKTPFGENFEKYSQVPHDIMIAQRVPNIFSRSVNSKLNYWWSHDLALKRSFGHVTAQIWNIDRFLPVSKWHVEQVKEVYNISDDFISHLPNGVDSSNYEKVGTAEKIKSKTLIFSSRPERGLENLVGAGGIMEQLKKIDPEIRLIVAGYDNTTQDMAEFYNHLWKRCEELPNVINYGPLSKKALAKVQCGAWLYVYPTDFKETSCITAMESQTAGTPFIHAGAGALNETLEDGGHIVCEPKDFAEKIGSITESEWLAMNSRALKKAGDYSYEYAADKLLSYIEEDFKKQTSNNWKVYRHLIYNSDIIAANKYRDKKSLETPLIDYPVDFKKFYEGSADRNKKIGNKHNLGNYDAVLKLGRLRPIINELEKLPPKSQVLDYGCGVGHATHAFAKRFPDLVFSGCDISEKNIKTAVDHDFEGQKPSFFTASSPCEITSMYDFVIAAEVLEHVIDFTSMLAGIEMITNENGRITISTPAGPVEAARLCDDIPVEHLHHFEEEDIKDIIGKKENVNIIYLHDIDSIRGDKIGAYCWTWSKKTGSKFGQIDYERKFSIQRVRQRVSCCMIVKSDSEILGKTLSNVQHFADQFIVGVDGALTPILLETLKKYNCQWIQIDSPLKIGFDAARNLTLEKADGDWILWIDDDETWNWPERTAKYLRNNQFDSYAIAQHHFSAEPAGLMKTDFPARIFRNNGKVKFFGLVHEHPEIEINKGIGKTYMLGQTEGSICHNGYDTEDTRRKRFVRNIPLMKRDREKYPNRTLGKFLWVRDLAHCNRYEFEQTGVVSNGMLENAKEALKIWRGLVADAPLRLSIDALPYLAEAVEIVDPKGGMSFKFSLELQYQGKKGNPQQIEGRVIDNKDLDLLMDRIKKEQTEPLLNAGEYV